MKMENNIFGLRGKLGNVVYKKYSYGTVITAYPDMSRAGCSVDQRKQRSRFKQAVSWAKEALSNPETKNYYENLPGKGSALNKAIAAFLKQKKFDV